MVSPAQRRKAANYLVRRFKVSQRRACKVVGQHRSTQRYEAIVPETEAKLVKPTNIRGGDIAASRSYCATKAGPST
jgi:hypothetical protein